MTVRLRERVPLAAVLSVGTAIVVVLVLVLLLVRGGRQAPMSDDFVVQTGPSVDAPPAPEFSAASGIAYRLQPASRFWQPAAVS